jgi:hypothetical protein
MKLCSATFRFEEYTVEYSEEHIRVKDKDGTVIGEATNKGQRKHSGRGVMGRRWTPNYTDAARVVQWAILGKMKPGKLRVAK